MVEFEWDDEKNRLNKAKHGLDFADAVRVFLDPRCYVDEDRTVDYGEHRYKVTGYAGGKLVTVIYAERKGLVRLISAYKPSPQERKKYEGNIR